MLMQGVIKSTDISLFLKAGELFDKRSDKVKPLDMEEKVWKNLLALSEHRFNADTSSQPKFFQLPDCFTGDNAKEWMTLYKHATPENMPIPEGINDIIKNSELDDLLYACFYRCLREDRTLIVVSKIIAKRMGPYFVKPIDITMEGIFKSASKRTPIL